MEPSHDLERHVPPAQGSANTAPGSPSEFDAVSILGSICDAFFAVDGDWRVTYLSSETLWDKRREHLLGRNLWEEFPDAVGSYFCDELTRAGAARERRAVVFECVSPVGGHWIEVSARAAGDGLAICFRDIGGRKEMEDRLRVSQERFDQLAENIGSVFWITDLPQRKVVYVSPAYERLWGMSREQLYADQRVWVEAVHPEDRERVERAFIEKVAAGRFDEEYRIIRPDGAVHWVRDRGFPIRDDQGEATRVAGIAEDITDRKRIEEERDALFVTEQQARREAEAANRLKDEFLATLSHELRTPLTSVLGWARLLLGGKIDEATAARALEVIERNAEAQQKLVEDLMDVSRIITGKLRLEMRPVELTSVVGAAVDAVRPAAEAKDIRLSVEADAETALVAGDPDRLQQVVWNLLTNAIKFTPKRGRVEVRLERVGSNVRIKVSDTGQGIAPDFLPYVFERFRQADQSTSRAYSGLGLGLAVVRHLVEQHGGHVAADSAGEQQGSTFIVELPVAALKVESYKVETALPTLPRGVGHESNFSLTGTRLLVVEDQPDARELLSTLLRQYGAEVVTASSAAEALEAMGRDKPDVLISDIGMPEEDGYVLIGKVRALAPEQGGKTPAVALTAYAREEDRARALAAGFQAHVSKPVEPEELVTVVASLVR